MIDKKPSEGLKAYEIHRAELELKTVRDEKMEALMGEAGRYNSFDDKIKFLVGRAREWVSKEKMTPQQRNLTTYAWKDPDHVLGGFAFWAPICVGITDITCRDYHVDAKKMYYAQLLSLNRFHYDVPALFTDVYNYDVEAIGTKVAIPEHSMPEIVDRAIKKPEDLLKLKVPDPEKDARMPYVLAMGRIHRENLGDLFPTVLSTNAPFSMAVGLRGYSKLIQDMKKNGGFVHNLMEFCTEVCIVFGKALIKHAGIGPVLSDAWACPPNLSIEQIHEFVVPYTPRALEALHHPGYFYAWGYSWAPNWPGFLRTINGMGVGTNCLFAEDILGMKGYGKVDLVQFAEICKKQKTVLFTNPHPDTIFNGPPELIRYYVLDWHRKASPGGGHAYYTSIPAGTPFSHVEAYVAAYKDCTFPVEEAPAPPAIKDMIDPV